MENYSREELEKLIEKAKKELEEKLAKMTPEERERAEAKANRLIKEDEERRRKLIEDGARIAAGLFPEKNTAPKICPNCGAAAESGKFCTFCGSLLQKDTVADCKSR